MKKEDIGLLVLRLAAGGAMLTHGWGKLTNFSTVVTQFPDPIGLGANVSLALTVFAEVFCAVAIIIGLFTRFAAIPLAITMLVAAFVIHGADPFAKKEMAILFLSMYITLSLTGAGNLAVDRFMGKK